MPGELRHASALVDDVRLHSAELWGQPFMAFGTRHALGPAARSAEEEEDVAALARMNALPGTARAFSRMVRDVISWRGQTRLFLQRAHEVETFPPIAVFWGERDAITSMTHGKAFAARMPGAVFRSFPGAGHYVHRDSAEEFADAARQFLDDPDVEPARLRGGGAEALAGSR